MLVIQTDYSTPAAALGRRAHSHREALSDAAFLVDKVWRSHTHSSCGDDSIRWTRPSKYAWRVVVSMRLLKFEGIITVLLR